MRKDYEAEYSRGGAQWYRVQGVDLSGGGMCVLSETEISMVALRIRMTLDGREVNLRAQPVWNSTLTHNRKPMHCYGMQFASISAEDWGTIIRWITGDEPSKTEELAAIRMSATEVVQLLPFEFRKRLLEELAKLSRFDPRAPAPVQFDYGGVAVHEGTAMHKLTLHSRMKNGSRENLFTTRFLVDERGERIIALS